MTRPIVFMFTGQGSHYYQMAHALYKNNNLFKKYLQQLDDIAYDEIGTSIIDELYNKGRHLGDWFAQTIITHPALFIVQYALARVLLEMKITPDYVMGSSLGEFVAAAVAGAVQPEESLISVIKQAQLLEAHNPKGGMIAILKHHKYYETTPTLYNNSTLVGVNTDSHFVIAGKTDALAEIAGLLSQENVVHQSLQVSQGFHSPLIDPAKLAYIESLAGMHISDPQIHAISCTNATVVTNFQSTYFWDIIRQPVQLQKTVAYLEKRGGSIYLDLGPSGTFAGFIKRNIQPNSTSIVFPISTPFGNDHSNLEKIVTFLNSSQYRPPLT